MKNAKFFFPLLVSCTCYFLSDFPSASIFLLLRVTSKWKTLEISRSNLSKLSLIVRQIFQCNLNPRLLSRPKLLFLKKIWEREREKGKKCCASYACDVWCKDKEGGCWDLGPRAGASPPKKCAKYQCKRYLRRESRRSNQAAVCCHVMALKNVTDDDVFLAFQSKEKQDKQDEFNGVFKTSLDRIFHPLNPVSLTTSTPAAPTAMRTPQPCTSHEPEKEPEFFWAGSKLTIENLETKTKSPIYEKRKCGVKFWSKLDKNIESVRVGCDGTKLDGSECHYILFV